MTAEQGKPIRESLIPTYKIPERSPFVVAPQTHRLLMLFKTGAFTNFSFGKDYIKQYTFPYLTQAEANCATIFGTDGEYKGNADPETREAAHHVYTVFAWMPDMTAVPGVKALEDGFARKGMLRAQ